MYEVDRSDSVSLGSVSISPGSEAPVVVLKIDEGSHVYLRLTIRTKLNMHIILITIKRELTN